MKLYFLIFSFTLSFLTSCQEKQTSDSITDHKSTYLDYSNSKDQFTGGINMIPITTPKGIFNVSSSTGNNESYYVFSMMGQQILSSSENTFDLSNYPNGVYFVKSATTSKTYKIIKN